MSRHGRINDYYHARVMDLLPICIGVEGRAIARDSFLTATVSKSAAMIGRIFRVAVSRNQLRPAHSALVDFLREAHHRQSVQRRGSAIADAPPKPVRPAA